MIISSLDEFLFDHHPNGLLIADVSGQIEAVNPAAAALLDRPAESLIGTHAEQVFDDHPTLVRLFAGEAALDVPLPKRRLAAGTAAALADGRRVIVLQDVTEQREFEARHAVFVAKMAHDLRNPIAAMIGYAALVEAVGDLTDEQRLYLTRVSDTATKLHDTAPELVDLAWLEAGMPLKFAALQLKQPIESAITALTALAQAKAITIFVSVQDPLPSVMGDEAHLRTAIYKLLQNAILYSASERNIAVHAWSDARQVFCSVADQGIGIAQDELGMIFDRTYRSHDPRVRELPGSGLGLTLARRIITRHGGELSAVSELDKGSTFTLRLPALEP